MHLETIFLILFTVATAVAVAARRFRIPYTVALVAAGLILGAAHVVEAPHLTRELLYSLVLPGLLYDAAFHIDLRDFRRNQLAIYTLAAPGVVASIGLTAVILMAATSATRFVTPVDFGTALVFGSLIAATDPIAVTGLFRSLGAPRRLRLLVEGESLLNDGTAIVLFTLTLGVVGGGALTGGFFLDFVRVVGTGLVTGVVVGGVASRLIRMIDDPMIEITLTTIAAYGSFLLAELFGGSGVIGTVAAGMLSGNYAARTGMSASTRIAVETFWEYVAFALNSIVFLLIGFEISIDRLLNSWRPIVFAYLAVLMARGVVVFGVSGLLRRSRERIPWSWSPVISWAGLRGALSMVLVLGLTPTFPHRDLLVTITFGVVLLTIGVQGLTMSPLLRGLGLVGVSPSRRKYELERGRLLAGSAALAEIDDMKRRSETYPAVLERLRSEYEERERKARDEMRKIHVEERDLEREELRTARRRVLQAEKEAILDASQRGLLGRETYEHLLADADARILELEKDEPPTGRDEAARDEETANEEGARPTPS
jgi:CPA1 family monovalent cation:H+ antiporter